MVYGLIAVLEDVLPQQNHIFGKLLTIFYLLVVKMFLNKIHFEYQQSRADWWGLFYLEPEHICASSMME